MLHCYSRKCFTVVIILMLMVVKTTYAAMRDTTVMRQGNKTSGLVTGMVINTDGQAIKGVTVSIKNTNNFVETDEKGHFEINAPAGSLLVFSAANYYVREMAAAGADMKVRLLDNYLRSPSTLDVLYGTEDAASEVGAISTVHTDQLTTTDASMFYYALPGQLTGLYTDQISGFMSFSVTGNSSANEFVVGGNTTNQNIEHNNNTEIVNTLRGQTPITIIDGVQRDIGQIDMQSIESISVLKDALSCMLLGINSSNGVILVTTKRAKSGRPSISFTAEAGVQNSLNLPTPLPAAQWAYLYNEALTNDGQPAFYTSADLTAYQNHSDPY